MAVESGNSTAVGNAAAVRMSSPNVPAAAKHHVTVTNTGAQTIYVGATSAVTSSTGYPLLTGETIAGELEAYEELWGICAAAQSSAFAHLRTGV